MTEDDILRAKSELRLKARAARRALTPEEHEDAARRIALMLVSLPELSEAGAILAYAAMREEIDPGPAVERLAQRGVRVALPRAIGPNKLQLHWWQPGDMLSVGKLGVREPLPDSPVAPVAAIDAVLTPGVAYDRQGWRLGLGLGYFDALFAEMHASVVRIGLAYEEQLFPGVPHEEHDQPMSLIVTQRHVYRPGGRRR